MTVLAIVTILGGSGEHLALILLVQQNTGQRLKGDNFDGFDGFGGYGAVGHECHSAISELTQQRSKIFGTTSEHCILRNKLGDRKHMARANLFVKSAAPGLLKWFGKLPPAPPATLVKN